MLRLSLDYLFFILSRRNVHLGLRRRFRSKTLLANYKQDVKFVVAKI